MPLVAALIAGWHLPRHRRASLIATVCFTLFGAIFTVFYVYPINAVLFEQAGGNLGTEQIRALATQWVFRDRVRFGIGLIGFVAVLHAFRLPIPDEATRKSAGA